MGQWIEFRKERRPKMDQFANKTIDPSMTYKRALEGLQNGGVYGGPMGMHNTMAPPAH